MLLGLQGKENKEVQEESGEKKKMIVTFLLSSATLVEKRSFPRSGAWRKGEKGGREGVGQEQVTPCRGRQVGRWVLGGRPGQPGGRLGATSRRRRLRRIFFKFNKYNKKMKKKNIKESKYIRLN